MGDTINNIPSYGIKQYIVNGADGPSVVRVSFNADSSSTTTQSSGAGNGVLINIGTKNLSSNADVSNAINRAVYSNATSMVSQSAANILNSAEDAIKAASVEAPNEDVMGLLV